MRAMIDLANQPRGKAVTLAEIAARQEVKPKYLEQIFIKLHHANLIKSKKGPGGGYFLGRNPKLIKVSEIITAVGETKNPVFCVDDAKHEQCPRVRSCPTRPYWQKLKNVIETFFDSYTLYDLCE
jgi:Rrf2 family protein